MFSISSKLLQFADRVNFLAGGWILNNFCFQQRKKFIVEAKYFIWDDPSLYKLCLGQVIRRCEPEEKFNFILSHCHDKEASGHFKANRTATKILQSGFFQPTLFYDAKRYVSSCDHCQRIGNISKRDKMPLTNILVYEIFNV